MSLVVNMFLSFNLLIHRNYMCSPSMEDFEIHGDNMRYVCAGPKIRSMLLQNINFNNKITHYTISQSYNCYLNELLV